MTALLVVVSALLRGLDALYDMIGAVARIAARGAFTPDRRSYRGRRFHRLAPDEALVQRVRLNAADEGEARRVIAIEPERYLPLPLTDVLVDVAGPCDTPRAAGGERDFTIGLLRRDTAARWRATHPAPRLDGVEAFVLMDAGGRPLRFQDQTGLRLQHRRRAALTAAAALFTWSAFDLLKSFDDALTDGAAASEQASRALRVQTIVAARETARLDQTLANFRAGAARSAKQVADLLNRVAVRVPPTSELKSLTIEPNAIALTARAYSPVDFELGLRRGFEGDSVDVTARTAAALQDFEAHVSTNYLDRSGGR